MMQQADIVKISDEDLDWLRPGPEGASEKAAVLRAETGALVILTRGAEGAEAHSAAGVVLSPARKVQVVDTVGAGDTFNAGLLAALAQAGCLTKEGLAGIEAATLGAALDFGAQVAAVTVSRAGANPPWRAELEG